MNPKQFRRRLLTILAHNKVIRPVERERSGLINSKRLGLYGTTDRLFRRRPQEPQEGSYAISLLLDGSGSMLRGDNDGKTRLEFTAEAAHALALVLDEVAATYSLALEYEIATFAATDYIIKPFHAQSIEGAAQILLRGYGDKEGAGEVRAARMFRHSGDMEDIFDTPISVAAKVKRMLPELADYSVEGSAPYRAYNTDALAVWRASRRLAKRAAQKKVLITLSDGSPADWEFFYGRDYSTIRGDKRAGGLMRGARGSSQRLRRAVEAIKREGEISLLGLGIQTNEVKHFYPKWARVDDLSGLFTGLARLMSREIKKI